MVQHNPPVSTRIRQVDERIRRKKKQNRTTKKNFSQIRKDTKSNWVFTFFCYSAKIIGWQVASVWLCRHFDYFQMSSEFGLWYFYCFALIRNNLKTQSLTNNWISPLVQTVGPCVTFRSNDQIRHQIQVMQLFSASAKNYMHKHFRKLLSYEGKQ